MNVALSLDRIGTVHCWSCKQPQSAYEQEHGLGEWVCDPNDYDYRVFVCGKCMETTEISSCAACSRRFLASELRENVFRDRDGYIGSEWVCFQCEEAQGE